MSNFIKFILNNFSPPASCVLCGDNSLQAAFCPACARALPWLPAAHCPRCAIPTLNGGLCGQCLKAPPAFDQTHATFLYTDALAQLIPAAKFGARWPLLTALTQLMLPPLKSADRPDMLIPLPLHPQRLQERGYNQAQEIAAPLASALQLRLELHLLQRIKDTEHQARLSEKARHHNMRRAFAATEDLTGLHIALIDDVMTTGSSLDAAARALKKAGAARVDCWILARTP